MPAAGVEKTGEIPPLIAPPILAASGGSCSPAYGHPVAWRPAPPAVWPALVIVGSTIPVTFMVGVLLGVVLVMVALSSSQSAGTSPTDAATHVVDVLGTPAGLLSAIAIGQAIFLAAALLGVAVTRGSLWRNTLGLVRHRGPRWLPLLLALSTMCLYACVSGAVWSILPEDLLRQDIFARVLDAADTRWFIALVIGMSVVPALIEEMLFRGYLQRRLLLRWNPWLAILTSTGLFAIAHMSLQTITVIPLGFWLGVMAWRTGSIWPGVLCHAFNNAVAFIMYTQRDVVASDPRLHMMWRIVLLSSVVALMLSVYMLWRAGKAQPSTSQSLITSDRCMGAN